MHSVSNLGSTHSSAATAPRCTEDATDDLRTGRTRELLERARSRNLLNHRLLPALRATRLPPSRGPRLTLGSGLGLHPLLRCCLSLSRGLPLQSLSFRRLSSGLQLPSQNLVSGVTIK